MEAKSLGPISSTLSDHANVEFSTPLILEILTGCEEDDIPTVVMLQGKDGRKEPYDVAHLLLLRHIFSEAGYDEMAKGIKGILHRVDNAERAAKAMARQEHINKVMEGLKPAR